MSSSTTIRGALRKMPGRTSETQRRIHFTERVCCELQQVALTPDQAERIASVAMSRARVAGHPTSVGAERIGLLIDFAKFNMREAKLLASRMLRKAIAAEARQDVQP